MIAVDRVWGVVPAAGVGKRFGSALPKQYLQLAGQSVLERSVAALLSLPQIKQVMIAISAEDRWFSGIEWEQQGRVAHCTGGETRADSVMAALKALPAADRDGVLVHDAARPCVRPEDLKHLWQALHTEDIGGLLAHPVSDTLKRSNDGRSSLETVDRRQLWCAQTPQMFRYRPLLDALEMCRWRRAEVTDEASAIELRGGKPVLVEGRSSNIKITHSTDLQLAEAILQAAAESK